MGIQGLMSFVGDNDNLFKDLQMKNTKIIIDGNNLYHKLYFDSGLDLLHGGDYDAFTDVLNKFFESLSKCHIQAYVVLDGGCDISDKKIETQKQRFREKIKAAESLWNGRGGSVLPLLIREVFIQVLRKLQVPFVQCFSEADREIVALANLWNCPVLTFDSDFCIFDVKAGYCPQNSFQWKTIVTSGNGECYIQARSFSVQRFCKYFNNLNMSLLPLFAVLMGNDYISLSALETFFSNVHLPIGNSGHSGRKHTRIRGLLNWLSGFESVAEAMDSVMKHLRLKDRDSVRQLLYSAMEEYSLYDTVNLEQYFQTGTYVSPTAVELNLPDWVQRALARGELSPFLSDALVLKRVFLHTQVEDIKRPSAHFITQPIRKMIYTILFHTYQNSQQGPEGNKQPNELSVVEFDRLETTLRKSTVEICFARGDFTDDLSLQNLPKLPLVTCLNLLLRALDLRMDDLASVPPDYQLIVAIIHYWIRHADPKVKEHHLKALLMGIVYGETYNILNKPELQGDGIKLVCEQMHRIKMEGAQQRRPNWEDLHILCQWQCCLQMVMHFNQFLLTPLPEPDITRLYSGSLVYYLTQKIKSSPTTEDLFKPCPLLAKLYQDCICAVRSVIPQDYFQSTSSAASKSRKKRAQTRNKAISPKARTMEEDPSQCNISNRFAGLLLED